jgi:quercetin 2,3-dioxygenase
MQIIRADDRFHIESDWLSAYWLFSFDRYYDPQNVTFGPLRVFNHDTVQPRGGFPTHSHREMEIVTYVLEGALRHKDSTGGMGIISAGEVQRISAGTGVAHSEFNSSEKEPCQLLQMWVLPSKDGLRPSYEQKKFPAEARAGSLLPIASGQGRGDGVRVEQDATFYVSTVGPGDHISHRLSAGRRAFLYVIEGDLSLNGESLSTGDQARVSDLTLLRFSSTKPSELMLIDLP